MEMQNLGPGLPINAEGPLERRTLKKPRELECLDVSCLIINKMIGTGIFVSPAIVVLLAGSKWAALLMWVFGACYSFASILVYLEYGLAWPFNGGELIYIGKILPRPSIIAQCSFAWFFVCFSTSTGNAISFARFVGFAAHPDREMDEWLQKFIGCWLIVGICLLHYRLVNIGIWANNLLAAFKVVLVLVFVLIGLLGGLPKESSTDEGIPGASDFGKSNEMIRAPANSALAIFLVLYSYQGWENANYVTAEIKGDDEEKRKTLKKGALIAVAIFWVLGLDDILGPDQQEFTIVYDLVLKSIRFQHPTRAKKAVSVLVAMSALGNLIGVIFTNGRGKFARSTAILATITSFIDQAAVPLLPNSLEGFYFIINTYTYGHSILNLSLAFGILFPILVHRMNAYSTATVDNLLLYKKSKPNWSWQILRCWPFRWACAGFLILVNIFLVILPFIPTAYTNGSPRKIPSWSLPVTVLPFYVAGAVAGLFIVFISTKMEFFNSHVVEDTHRVDISNFVYPERRRWDIHYPEFGALWRSIRQRNGIHAVVAETKLRLFHKGEAQTAHDINEATNSPIYEPMHVWGAWGKLLSWRQTRRELSVPIPES
ncbi:hypothetical protein MMC07_001066 [Pseudocyphellaria aurata]|nr:hypothetical protein [Pseudocyphellaria aurata]